MSYIGPQTKESAQFKYKLCKTKDGLEPQEFKCIENRGARLINPKCRSCHDNPERREEKQTADILSPRV